MKISGELHSLVALPPYTHPLTSNEERGNTTAEPEWTLLTENDFFAPALNQTKICR